MDTATKQSVGKATLPVWAMVGVAVLVIAFVLAMFTVPVLRAGVWLSEINDLHAAERQAENDVGRYLQAVNTQLRARAALGQSAEIGDEPVVSPPNMGQLVAHVHGEQHLEMTRQSERAEMLFIALGKTLVEEKAEYATRCTNAMQLRADRAAFSDAMLRLRSQISQAEGRARLAAARARKTDETGPPPASLQPLLVEALELGLQTRDLEECDDEDRINDAINNHLEPSLARLSDLAAIASPENGAANTMAETVAAIVTSLKGNPQSGVKGIVRGLQESRMLSRKGQTMRVAGGAQLAQVREVQETVRKLVDDRMEVVRAELRGSLNAATWQAATASGVGMVILLSLARLLARNARTNVATLADTVFQLQQSRAQLVDIAELRAAMQATEIANAEMQFQKQALDYAGIVSEADAERRITYVNDRFCAISKYTREELIGQDHRIVNSGVHPEEFWKEMYTTLARTGVWTGAVCNRAKDGGLFWVQSTILAVRNSQGIIDRYVSVRSDITDRVNAEQALQAQADDLIQARHAAESSNRAKSEFLATMSHEIRTPLNGVVGTLELMQGSTLTEQQRRYIQIGKTSALSLTSVINDILDFSKIEAGKLELCPTDFDLRTVVEDVMEMLAVRASEKHLELACSIEPCIPELVRGDPDRLRQIIINLVNNAIKFTERGSVVLRVADGAANGTPRLRFSVTDTGVGVPKDRIDRLFKAFSQADATTTRKFGGTGLGLAISKQLAELMGGAIGVESELGRGSTFWFEAVLPAAESPLKRPDTMTTIARGAVRLLVIEDHEVQREHIGDCLRALRFHVETAPDGQVALAAMLEAAASGCPFDVILTDQEMPGMDGIEVAVAMKSKDELRGIPVILLSSALDLDPKRVQAAGFASHLTKPVRQSALLDAVMNATVSVPGKRTSGNGLIPLAKLAGERPAEPQNSRPRMRVLLAEDNEINQLIACELLSKAGFICTVAPNGAEAVAAVSKTGFDVVLMDCQMPEMDGFEATRAIRMLESSGQLTSQKGRLPIIALTANALKGDQERCLEAGMDSYASKPIDLKTLLATIETVCASPPMIRAAA